MYEKQSNTRNEILIKISNTADKNVISLVYYTMSLCTERANYKNPFITYLIKTFNTS